MSRGSRLGIDTDAPRPAGLDEYPLVATPGWTSPAEAARAVGNAAPRGNWQDGEASSAFQEAYESSLDLDLLRQYAELYAELTGTMLVPIGEMGQTPGGFAADPNQFWQESEQTPTAEQPPLIQPAAVERSAPASQAPETIEEPNPVLSALGFFDVDDVF